MLERKLNEMDLMLNMNALNNAVVPSSWESGVKMMEISALWFILIRKGRKV